MNPASGSRFGTGSRPKAKPSWSSKGARTAVRSMRGNTLSAARIERTGPSVESQACPTCGMVTLPDHLMQHFLRCPDHDPTTCDACIFHHSPLRFERSEGDDRERSRAGPAARPGAQSTPPGMKAARFATLAQPLLGHWRVRRAIHIVQRWLVAGLYYSGALALWRRRRQAAT